MIRLTLILIMVAGSAFGQTWNQADSLTNLLTKTPIVNGLYSVRGYRVAGDWGEDRIGRHVQGSTVSTNLGNVFTFGSGRLIFADQTNTVQDVRWWGGRADGSTDNAAALLASGEWGGRLGGGVRVPGAASTWVVANQVTSTNSWDLILEKGAVVNGTTVGTNDVFRWTGALEAFIALSANAEAGDYSLTLTTTNGIVPGDVFVLTSTNLWNPYRTDYSNGEMVTVRSITGGVVNLTAPLASNYATNNTAKINRLVPVRVRISGGGRIACPSDGVGIRITRSRDSRIDDIELTGSGKSHVYVYESLGFTADRLWIESELGEGTGFGYGIGFVGVQGGVLSRSRIATSRHGFTAGGGGSIVNRDIRVVENVFQTYGTSAASVDFHGNCENYTVAFNAMDAGVSVSGNKGSVLFNQVKNAKDQPAIGLIELSGTEFNVSGNALAVSDDGSSGTVFAMRFRLERAQAIYGVSTNDWLGTITTTPPGRLRITDNSITVGTRTGDPMSLFFFDSESNLPANITYGGLEFSGNVFSVGTTNGLPANPWALNIDHANEQIRWESIRVARNDFGPLPVSISANAKSHSFDRNTWSGVVPANGALLVRGGAGFIATSVGVNGNTFRGIPTFGTYLLDVTGRAVFSQNHFEDWAQSAGWGAISATAGVTSATNLVSIALSQNTYQTIGSAPGAVQLSTTTPTITALDERLPAGFALHAGTTPTAALTWSTTNSMLKATGAPLVVQSYPAVSLPVADDGALAFDTTSSNLVVRVSGAWLAVSGNTNAPVTGGSTFDNIVVTNRTYTDYVVTRNISINGTGTNQNSVTATYPIYAAASTNALSRIVVYNNGTGSSVGSALQLQTGDASARFDVWSTNNSTANFKSRAVLEAITGSGISFDLTLPSSMEVSWTHGGGTEFASMDTNLFRLYTPSLQADAGLSTKAATNVLGWVGGWVADPTTSAQAFVSTTIANLANQVGGGSFLPLTGGTLSDRLTLYSTNKPTLVWSLPGVAAGRSNWVMSAVTHTNFIISPSSDDLLTWSGIELRRDTATPGELERVLVNSPLHVEDEVYGVLWNGSTEVPTKNAVYDKIESMPVGGGSVFVEGVSISNANFAESSEIQWDVTSVTNVTPSIKASSIATNKIDSTFYSWINGKGSGSVTIFDEFGNVKTNVTSFKIESADITKTVNYQVSGSGTNIVINSTEAVAPLLIAGNSTADGQRFHINSTTPAAPAGMNNVVWQVNSTNASAYIPLPNIFNIGSIGTFFFEDFLSDSSSANNVWTAYTQTSGTVAAVNVETNMAGVFRLRAVNNGASSGAAVHQGLASVAISHGTLTNEWKARIANLATQDVDKYDVLLGLADTRNASSLGQADGAYFFYNTNSSPNWQIGIANNSSYTTADSGVTVTTNWTKFLLSVDAAATGVRFFINGSEASGSPLTGANLPITRFAGLMANIIRTNSASGTVNQDLFLDYCAFSQHFNAAR